MIIAAKQNASNFVAGVDLAFIVILGISVFFLILLTVVMLVFMRKYRRDKHPKAIQNEGSTKLEILWTVIPLILVLLMFYYGWAGWKPMTDPPDEARHIKAIARMWNFKFEYENGKMSDTLYVPVNEPVIIDLVALDVLHSLYIPAFRVKEDMVPGQDKIMWFIPEIVGEYDLFCAEYCGLEHSYMYSSVRVMEQEDFQNWVSDTTAVELVIPADMTAAEMGFEILVKNGCNACHSSNGTKLVGPSYLGVWGRNRLVKTGNEEREVMMDGEYIKKSIYDPNADIAEGFSKGLMLTYEGLISPEEAELIIEYIKDLNEK